MSTKVEFEISSTNAVDLNVNPGTHYIEVDFSQWDAVDREYLKTRLDAGQFSMDIGLVCLEELSEAGLKRSLQAMREQSEAHKVELKRQADELRAELMKVPIEDFLEGQPVPQNLRKFFNMKNHLRIQAEHIGRGDEFKKYWDEKCAAEKQRVEKIEAERVAKKEALRLKIEEERAPYLARLDPVLLARVRDGFGHQGEIDDELIKLIFSESKYADYPPLEYSYECECDELSNESYLKFEAIRKDAPEGYEVTAMEGHNTGGLHNEITRFVRVYWEYVGYSFSAYIPLETHANVEDG